MKKQVYKISHLHDGTVQIEENGVRSFLVPGSEKALLIDTGFGTGDLKAVCRSLTDLPIALINTHADRDHLGCNEQFGEAYMHADDFTRAKRSLPEGFLLKPVQDGDVFDLGGRKLEVLHIPGHTPGSITLLDRGNRILFSGDSVQDGAIYMFGEGRHMEQFCGSMEKLLKLRGLFNNIYPCHHGIPVSPDVIPVLLAGAEKALKGELTGEPADMHGTTVRLCDVGGPAFLLPL